MFGKLLLITLLLALATDNANSKGLHRGLRRNLKKDKGGGNSNANSNAGGLEESGECLRFEDSATQSALGQTAADDVCQNNECAGGCCRFFNYLECDDDNQFPQLRCVCNGNTNNTHLEVDDPGDDRNSTNSTDPIVFPAVAGDCDEPTPFQQIPVVTPCSQQSNCTGVGECCVKYFCFCKVPNPAFNEELQCVPDP